MAKQIVALGDTGNQLVSKLANNFDELYLGSGGIGYIIQPTDAINTDAWWTTMIATYNTFSIINDYDFGGATVNLPADVVLLFNGGVWSNGTVVGSNTIFDVYGYQQCFTTTLTLSGTWKVDEITPQHYGAITNANTGIFANDCTAILQKCVDSIFDVYCPAGLYYVASSVIITKTKTVRCFGTGSYVDGVVTDRDHTRFYTNLDIDMFIFRAAAIKLDKGTIDVTSVASFTKSCILLDANYELSSLYIDMALFGSRSKLRAKTHTGKGIYVNSDITTIAWRGAYFPKIKGIYSYFKYAIYVPQMPDIALNTYFSIFTIEADFYGNKQHIYIHVEKSELGNVNAFCNGDYVCTVDELPLYSIDVTCSETVFDCMVVDHGISSGGYYSPNHLLNNGVSNYFINKSLHYYTSFVHTATPAVPITPLINPTGLLITSGSAPFISVEENMFTQPLTTITGTEIAMYDGTGYDFDTKLDSSAGEGLGAPLSMNVYNAPLTSLLNVRGEIPWIRFSVNNGGLLTDFIEVVIPYTDQWSRVLSLLGVVVSGYRFRRIQFIIVDPIEGDRVGNIYPSYDGVTEVFMPFTGYELFVHRFSMTKIIFRFIGAYTVWTGTENSYIVEVISKPSRDRKTPLIDIVGGQTIYGTLALSGTNNAQIWTDGTDTFRQQVRSGALYTDHTLTATGFAGIEGVDWEALSSIP